MIREKITMTVADISTTTLKDVQQIASILKQSVVRTFAMCDKFT